MIEQRAAPPVMPISSLLADLDTAGDGGQYVTGVHMSRAAVPIPPTDTGPGQSLNDAHRSPARLADTDRARTGQAPADAQDGLAGLAPPEQRVEPASDGQATSDFQGSVADLVRLHALLGVYARMLWDVQKERIGAGNRVAAMIRDGLEDFAKPAKAVVQEYEAIEKGIDRELTRLVRQHPLADWIAEQRGIGLPGFARLLGVTGSLDRFATVSKLWKYLGLHVVDGHAPRREKGVPWTHTNCQGGHLLTCKPECTTDHHPNCTPDGIGTAYAPQGRVVCHQLGESIVKLGHRKSCHQPACDDPTACSCLSECMIDHGGPYRRAYMAKKAYYEAEREDWSQARRHNAAMRFAVKLLIKEMWCEWHVRRPPKV